jgi:MFS transporter, PPP family, 3-phenylpropionic acid transporter
MLIIGGFAGTTIPGRTKAIKTVSMFHAPGAVLRHRPILIFLLGYLICFASLSAQATYLGPYMRTLGASNEAVGWAASIGALLEVPVMFFFPRIAARIPIERLIVLGATVMVVRYTANAVFTDPTVIIGCAVLQGFGYALLVVGGVAFVSREAPKGTAATAQGLLNGTAFSLAGILGMGVGGQIAALLSIRGLYFVSVLVGAIGLVVISGAVRGRSPDEAPQSRADVESAVVTAESAMDAEAVP